MCRLKRKLTNLCRRAANNKRGCKCNISDAPSMDFLRTFLRRQLISVRKLSSIDSVGLEIDCLGKFFYNFIIDFNYIFKEAKFVARFVSTVVISGGSYLLLETVRTAMAE